MTMSVAIAEKPISASLTSEILAINLELERVSVLGEVRSRDGGDFLLLGGSSCEEKAN